MKHAIASLALSALAAATGLAQTVVPEYAVVASRRIDKDATTKLQVHVAVQDGLSREQVASVVAAVVASNTALHAVCVSVIRKGEAPEAFTVANGEWAPFGDWDRAGEGLKDPQRATYRTKIAYRDSYFVPVTMEWAEFYGLTVEQLRSLSGELQAASLHADEQVWAKYPQGNPEESAKLTAAAMEAVAARYGLTRERALEAWGRYNRATFDPARPPAATR